MGNNTYKTLLLTVLTIICLIFLHFLPPMKVGGTELRRIDILADLTARKNTAGLLPPAQAHRAERVYRDSNGKKVNFKEHWKKGTEPITDFAEGQAGGPDAFYEKLTRLAEGKKNGRSVRIAYYGDSYIEVDILVEHLREALQKHYGGKGAGWLDAGNDLNRYRHTVTFDFNGMTEHMARKRNSYDITKAGPAERYYTANGKAKISMAPFMLPEFPRTMQWDVTQLYLRADAGAKITMTLDNNVSRSFRLPPSKLPQKVETSSPTRHATIGVEGRNLLLYAVAQEGHEGIVIDNFSMRGTAGQSLRKLPRPMLRRFATLRPYDLIVLQYGVNVVGEKTEALHLKRYMEQMKQVVENFRAAYPKAGILIIGAPDRGSKSAPDGTMPQLKALVGYQEKLAAECKVGFYNLFNAMGGAGTMKRIVETENMGSKDYIHINHKGGKYIAERMVKSFIEGQQNYARRRNYK